MFCLYLRGLDLFEQCVISIGSFVLVSVVPCKGGLIPGPGGDAGPGLDCEENHVLGPEGLGCVVQQLTAGSSR